MKSGAHQRVTDIKMSADGRRLIIEIPVEYVVAERRVSQPLTVNGLLTQRELQVFDLIRDGKQDKEIATELKVSLSGAKIHVASIYRKLVLTGRLDLCRRYPKLNEEVLVRGR